MCGLAKQDITCVVIYVKYNALYDYKWAEVYFYMINIMLIMYAIRVVIYELPTYVHVDYDI